MNNESIHGPHLAAAFFCERILQERDGVPSFIRVVERFTIPMPDPAKLPAGMQFPAPVLQVTLVVSIKAGTIGAGKYNLRVRLNKPDGAEMQDTAHPIFMNGSDDNGFLFFTPMVLVAPEEGLYWFDVYFETALLTRIPLRVIHQQIALPFQPGKGL